MSRFLDRLGQIKEGAAAPLGFGAPRAQKTPGMALVGLVSKNHPKGMRLVADLKPDAALVSGVNDPAALKEMVQSLGNDLPWGVRVSSLGEDDSQAYEQGGCDLLAFSLQGTTVAAVSSEEIARILCLESDIDLDQLRAISALPVDVLLLSMPAPSSPWTLEDLANIARVSRRVDKYVLVEIAQLPGAKELEALRSAGVNGLAVDVGSVSSKSLAELQAALLAMPRQRTNRKVRPMALLPRSEVPSGGAPGPAEPEPDEEEDE